MKPVLLLGLLSAGQISRFLDSYFIVFFFFLGFFFGFCFLFFVFFGFPHLASLLAFSHIFLFLFFCQ